MDLDAASGKETRQPKSIAPSFMGENDPGDLATRRRASGLETLDKRSQPVAASFQHMSRMAANSRQLNCKHPFLLAQFKRANDGRVVVDSSLRGSRELGHLPSPLRSFDRPRISALAANRPHRIFT